MQPQISLICRYDICAGHRLYRSDWSEERNQKAFGKCVRNHGHQYGIEVHLQGPIDVDTGMLINGFAVDEIVRPVVMGELDHKFLNEDVAFFREHLPTAEWIAFWVFDKLKASFPAPVRLSKVRVCETPELFAEYAAP